MFICINAASSSELDFKHCAIQNFIFELDIRFLLVKGRSVARCPEPRLLN